MYLIVGPSGVGKTVLLKRLVAADYKAGKNAFGNLEDIPSTIPTVGSNLVTVHFSKKLDITIREVGGSMGPIWQNYYEENKAVIYMVDGCNRLQVSSACIQLLSLLTHPALASSHVLIVFNKIDMPTRMTQSEVESMFRLQDIIKNAPQQITVLETSAHKGEGLQEVVRWLQQVPR